MKLASSAAPRTVRLRLVPALPSLLEGGDPTPPRGVIDVLTGAVFPGNRGGGCFGRKRSRFLLSEAEEQLHQVPLGSARQFWGEDRALEERAPCLTCLLVLICLLSLVILLAPLHHPSSCGRAGAASAGRMLPSSEMKPQK